MIDARNIAKHYGAQTVLRDATFRVNAGERVGLVGPNGAGKTTLFGLIIGEITADAGTIAFAGTPRIGYLRQQFSVYDGAATLLGHATGGRPDLLGLHVEMEALERSLAGLDPAAQASALARIGRLQSAYEAGGGYALPVRAAAALSGLGFPDGHFSRPFQSFSGGWQMRAELARVLVAAPDLLLLDEPTNYLDIPAIEWLREYLRGFDGTLMLISHDRYLLNSLTTTTIEVANGTTERYHGGYDRYVQEREERVAQRLAAAKSQEREREQAQRFIDRFRAKNTKASLVQSRIRKLARMEEVVVPQRIVSRGRIRLRPPARCGHTVASLEEVGLSYDGTTFVLRGLSLAIANGEKLALVGLNGTGKSTLLRILAGKLAPNEGRCLLGHNVTPGYQSQEFAETMDPERTVLETITACSGPATLQEIRTLLGGFGFSGEAVDKPVSVLSGGEKVRLAFARLLVNPPNFLILDEPTTHLDIAARESLEDALQAFPGTVCMVSHDIQFVRRVATRIAAMSPPALRLYCGDYDYYCDKLRQERADAVAPVAAESRSESERKLQRRERAAAVQERGRRRREVATVIADLERQIEARENEEKTLAACLQEPAPDTDFARVNRRLREIHYELPLLMESWQEAAERLQAIDAEAPPPASP
jgi:ATP-binding cassette subfamily F protein 3